MNLFKKAAVATDIHFGLKNNSVQHNEDCLNFVKWFIETSKQNGCDVAILCGDWHNHRASINIQTLNYSMQALELLNAHFSKVYHLVGNHDLYFRDKRDVSSVEWAKYLPNVVVVNELTEIGNVTLCPWLVGTEWATLENHSSRYMFGHFELPHFYMNGMITAPDHGTIQANHLKNFGHVYSGHYHKRQTRGNITYLGNAFPHNFGDAGDDERGMMILEWDKDPEYLAWPDQPIYRVYKLSDVLNDPDGLLLPNSHVRLNLDVDLSYEDASVVKEELNTKYNLRELTMIPQRANITDDNTDYSAIEFEGVDTIVEAQINELADGAFDRKILLEIYRSL